MLLQVFWNHATNSWGCDNTSWRCSKRFAKNPPAWRHPCRTESKLWSCRHENGWSCWFSGWYDICYMKSFREVVKKKNGLFTVRLTIQLWDRELKRFSARKWRETLFSNSTKNGQNFWTTRITARKVILVGKIRESLILIHEKCHFLLSDRRELTFSPLEICNLV